MEIKQKILEEVLAPNQSIIEEKLFIEVNNLENSLKRNQIDYFKYV